MPLRSDIQSASANQRIQRYLGTSFERAELPGLKPEEVNVELKEGNLWISGKKEE